MIACAKNDHLGFEVYYLWQGSTRRYVPDFIVRLVNGLTLVLEIKGQESKQDRAKRAAMKEWVVAVNTARGFGRWACDVADEPAQVHDIISRHAGGNCGCRCCNGVIRYVRLTSNDRGRRYRRKGPIDEPVPGCDQRASRRVL